MSKALVNSLFAKSSQTRKLGESIVKSETFNSAKGNRNIVISGLTGSSVSLVVADVFKSTNLPFLVVFNNKEEAAYHLNDQRYGRSC